MREFYYLIWPGDCREEDVSVHFWITENGYYYQQISEGLRTYPKKRISEVDFISLLEEYYNA